MSRWILSVVVLVAALGFPAAARAGPPTSISINDVKVTEGNSGTINAVFKVALSASSTNTVTVNFSTADNNATAGSDYVFTSGTLTFNPTDTSENITVTVNGDIGFEPNETFFVNLFTATNATIGDAQGQGTISNDDQPRDIRWRVVGGGGNNASSTNYAAKSTAGQGAIGASSSTNYALGAGYWAGVGLDMDSDGCTGVREAQPKGNAGTGGGRRDNTFWDFYDTPNASNIRDKVVNVTGDILRVAQRFGANDAGGAALINRNSDPLAGPIPAAPGYHPAFDRGPINGPNTWNMSAADGTISVVVDVLGVAKQFGHSCL